MNNPTKPEAKPATNSPYPRANSGVQFYTVFSVSDLRKLLKIAKDVSKLNYAGIVNESSTITLNGELSGPAYTADDGRHSASFIYMTIKGRKI